MKQRKRKTITIRTSRVTVQCGDHEHHDTLVARCPFCEKENQRAPCECCSLVCGHLVRTVTFHDRTSGLLTFSIDRERFDELES